MCFTFASYNETHNINNEISVAIKYFTSFLQSLMSKENFEASLANKWNILITLNNYFLLTCFGIRVKPFGMWERASIRFQPFNLEEFKKVIKVKSKPLSNKVYEKNQCMTSRDLNSFPENARKQKIYGNCVLIYILIFLFHFPFFLFLKGWFSFVHGFYALVTRLMPWFL